MTHEQALTLLKSSDWQVLNPADAAELTALLDSYKITLMQANARLKLIQAICTVPELDEAL